VTPRFAATTSTLFTELPFAARLDAGFEGSELWWPGESVPRGFDDIDLVVHVQIADHPGRAEYQPTGRTEDPLGWLTR
jgi:hydroxypyruvate isomerase